MQWRITFEEQLPYAIYQEMLAHLRQLPDLQVTSQRRQGGFDYLASPIAYLQLSWQSPTDLDLLCQILKHYGKHTITDLEAPAP